MRRAPLIAVALVCAVSAAFAAYRRTPAVAMRNDMSSAEARWKKAGLQKFTYQMSMLCLCAKTHPEPFTVTEDHGRVIAMTDSAGQAIELSGEELPVDSLFADIRRALRNRDLEAHVVFDSILGYPRSFSRGPAPGRGTFEPSTLYLDSLRAIP
jgi:hypothetical protein